MRELSLAGFLTSQWKLTSKDVTRVNLSSRQRGALPGEHVVSSNGTQASEPEDKGASGDRPEFQNLTNRG